MKAGNGLDKKMAADRLPAAVRQLHQRILRSFITDGHGPARERIDAWSLAGVDIQYGLANLEQVDLIAFDGHDGSVRTAYPFAAFPTGIDVTWRDGPTVHAMCAIDALGISAMIGAPTKVTGRDPWTSEAIRIQVDHDRSTWAPDGAVVFLGSSGSLDDCCASAERTCPNINFFTDARTAARWSADHPDINGTLLDQTPALALAVEEFGSMLTADD